MADTFATTKAGGYGSLRSQRSLGQDEPHGIAPFPSPLGPGTGLLISMSPKKPDGNADDQFRRARAFAKMARPRRRGPARPRLAPLPRRRRARPPQGRPQGRGGHRAESDKILLLGDRRGVRDRHPARGDGGAPGAAGAEGRGNPGRARRHRHIRSIAGPAQPARRRVDAGRGSRGRAGVGVLGGDRRGGLGQGRGAVFHHRAKRIRPDRPGAGAGHHKAPGQPAGAHQDHRRRRGRGQGAPGERRRSSPTASSARPRSR